MTDYINGRVKWFDNKKGYGFILSCEDSHEYFVHHARVTTDMQFSTLYDGEYVSFRLTKENDKVMADDVKGISRGPLLCETRQIKKEFRNNYKKQREAEAEPTDESVTEEQKQSSSD